MKLTQRQQLLSAFQEKGQLFVYEIMTPKPQGLGISQYGARILELRRQGHPIINDIPGHFIYKQEATMGDGYLKFQAMGMKLKGTKHEPLNDPEIDEIAQFTDEELSKKQSVAEKWLTDNETHPKYPQALSRFEKICNEIEARKVRSEIINEPEKGLYD